MGVPSGCRRGVDGGDRLLPAGAALLARRVIDIQYVSAD